MLLLITIASILFFAVLFYKLHYDINKWRKSQPVNHPKEAAAVTFGLIPSTVLFFIATNHNWYNIIPVLLMQFFIFWTMFDGLYNIRRHFNFFFTGSDDADDAKLDNLLQRMSVSAQAILKLGGCAIFIFLYIKTL